MADATHDTSNYGDLFPQEVSGLPEAHKLQRPRTGRVRETTP